MMLKLAPEPPVLADRHLCAVATTCQPPSSWVKDPWPAVIRSVWPRGMSLSLGRRFEKGSGLAVQLPGDAGSSSTVLGRVSRVVTHEDGYLLDVSFISELSDEEVGHVLNRTAEAPAEVEGVLFQTRLPDRSVLRWLVRRLDLPGGWPLPEGKTMTLALPGVAPVAIRVKVCRTFGSYRVIDVKLPDDVPAAAMALLMGQG